MPRRLAPSAPVNLCDAMKAATPQRERLTEALIEALVVAALAAAPFFLFFRVMPDPAPERPGVATAIALLSLIVAVVGLRLWQNRLPSDLVADVRANLIAGEKGAARLEAAADAALARLVARARARDIVDVARIDPALPLTVGLEVDARALVARKTVFADAWIDAPGARIFLSAADLIDVMQPLYAARMIGVATPENQTLRREALTQPVTAHERIARARTRIRAAPKGDPS